MAQRRHHYEQAFEHYLREQRVPYVAVNEARKALLPETTSSRLNRAKGTLSLKSFDFVLYGDPMNLLVEIKGRKIGGRPGNGPTRRAASAGVLGDARIR